MANTLSDYTILVVEDDVSLLESYYEVLKGEGFTVIKESDGRKALDVIKKSKKEINLILLDLMMPGLDGLSILEMMYNDKEMYGNAPVVVLSNMTSDKVIKESFDLGAVSFLVKNELSYEDLIKEIRKFLGIP